jgi:hydroxymethylpyrimidine/phosphomethylpyrimidine kinase
MISTDATESETVSIFVDATALTIGGSDPSGGAGLQADLKTFQQLGVYGMSAVTLLTVQNTVGVNRVEIMDPELVAEQIDAVMSDIPPRVVKTGALGNAAVAEIVGNRLATIDVPIVVDPVLVSKHGDPLADDDVVDAYRKFILPHATVVTPNRFEAQKITNEDLETEASLVRALEQFHELGVANVLLKNGAKAENRSHWFGSESDKSCEEWLLPNLPAENTHGSGCVLSALVAAAIAIEILPVSDACRFATEHTIEAISIPCEYGSGISPVDVRGLRPPTPKT